MIVFADIFRSNMFPDRRGKLGYAALCINEVKDLIGGKNAGKMYSDLDTTPQVLCEDDRFKSLAKQLGKRLPRVEAADLCPGDEFVLIPMDVANSTATYIHVWVEKE